MFKKVIFNTGSQIVGKAVTATSTLILTILIGRSLGPAGYGDFTKIFAFVGYFYTFSDFGLNNIFIKLTSNNDDAFSKNLFKVLVSLRIVIATTLAVVAIAVAYLLPYNASAQTGFGPLVKLGIVIAAVTILTQALLTTANAYFQKNLRYDLSAVATTLGSAAVLLFATIIFLKGGSLTSYVFAYVVGGIIFAASALALIFKKFKFAPTPTVDIDQFKKLINLSWPVGLALILNLIYFRVDVLILSYTRPTQEVGFYGLSYQFFEAFLTVPIFISNALYPLLAALYNQNRSDFAKQIRTYLVYLFLFSLVLSASLFTASFLIPIIYGTGFTPAVGSLRILSTGLPFFFISALLWHILIIEDRQKLLPAIYGVGAVFNVISNMIFIPIYGFAAAAATTVASEILILLLLYLALKIRID